MIGEKFGRWTVIQKAPSLGTGAKFLCSCACGTERIVTAARLNSGESRSCGCFRRELHTAHGKHGHPIYPTWAGMIARCGNKNHTSFARYGGRGITVCEDWRESPENFIMWAEASGWEPGLQLDRIDNDEGYTPSNCRIVRAKTNANNRSSCRHVEMDGVRLTVTEAAQKYGVNRETVYGRLNRGMPPELALKRRGA